MARVAYHRAGHALGFTHAVVVTGSNPVSERLLARLAACLLACVLAAVAAAETNGQRLDPVTPSDAAQAVLPRNASPHVPGAGALEDLHVVKYATGGAYGLHLDATCAVPRAVTVLHYLNDVEPEEGTEPGFCGETWLPLADADESSGPPRFGPHLQAGKDGVLVPPRAGDALVFFSFTDLGEVDAQSLHGGRPASQTKWVANQWTRLALEVDNDEMDADDAVLPRGPGFGPRVIG